MANPPAAFLPQAAPAVPNSSTGGYGSFGGPCPADGTWILPVALPATNQSILQFAVSNLGQLLGNGQCTELVNQWQLAQGLQRTDFGTTDGWEDYIWGTLITTITPSSVAVTNILPGDILQFQGVNFNSGGSWYEADHHTAIVAAVSPTDSALCVLQQNVTVPNVVGYGYDSLSGLQTGVIHVYRYH